MKKYQIRLDEYARGILINALMEMRNGLIRDGMPLREMDKIIYPVCKLCRAHEETGFEEGVKVGIHLAQELE